ncbi:MAG: hypothetical protein ABIK53_03710 [bacterium]
MLKSKKIGKNLFISTNRYSLFFRMDNLSVMLRLKDEKFYYLLSLISGCNVLGKEDECEFIELSTRREKDCILVELEEKSNIWRQKKYYFKCNEDFVEYHYTIRGKGEIDALHFFCGRYKGERIGSAPGFDTVFSSCPNFIEKNYYHPSEHVSISAGQKRDLKIHRGSALCCSPFCYALKHNSDTTWVSVGMAVKPGEYQFGSFDYAFRSGDDRYFGSGGFSLLYYGKVSVDGDWESPHLVFTFAKDEYTAIKRYINWLTTHNYLTKFKKKIYPWWLEPIFCGWGEQVALALLEKRDIKNLEAGEEFFRRCTQKLYQKWLVILEKHKIKPGTIIIDAKWQINNGDPEVNRKQWPDLGGFIDNNHRNNQKVILWINSWDREGIPDEECIKKNGLPVFVDPSNPAYEKRLRKRIREMISEEKGCLNADGFKIDGMLSLPIGCKFTNHGDIWGLELQKKYISIFYSEAKKYKEDALISVYTANPYFREVVDMVRCGDMYTIKGDSIDSMVHRAKIIEIGMFDLPIDTDGQYGHALTENWISAMEIQAKIGIPTLYSAENVSHGRKFRPQRLDKFTQRDYAFIAKVWEKYRVKISG